MQALPFKGYSWPFTQHAIALESKTLYGLLTCAAVFEGKKRVGQKITKLMIQNNLLTRNIRQGRADAWRDYQQVLAELGLIYSTKIKRDLRLTHVGKMYLSGEIGFSELMTSQALRYQYPNGQKYDLQARLRQQTKTKSTNLIDLYLDRGIFIKPAILIAQVLIELTERGEKATISIDECLAFLLPIKKNSAWKKPVDLILLSRKDSNFSSTNKHARRNIQDWFKFLSMTDFFETQNSKIFLSEYGKKAIDQLKEFCKSESKPISFWVPQDSDKKTRMDWFDYFGEMSFDQEITRPLDQIDLQYKKKNYIAGFDEDTDFAPTEDRNMSIELKKITRKEMRSFRVASNMNIDPNTALANLEEGIIKRRIKTQTHHEIVFDLAKHLQKQGAEVYEDLRSLDLLAVWPNNQETLFEIKTITRRSVQHRVRMGVGQLEEYAYRRKEAAGVLPDKVLVINTKLPRNSWYTRFLVKHMKISLLSKTRKGYGKNLVNSCKTKAFWNI